MEISNLLKVLSAYDPQEHRTGYLSFYCPSCQHGLHSGVRQAYIYAHGSSRARCSNLAKCGWHIHIAELAGHGSVRNAYWSHDTISPLDHPFWSVQLRKWQLDEQVVRTYGLVVFTDESAAPHPQLYERLCFPIYTLTGQFVGYTGRAKAQVDVRWFHFLLQDMNSFLAYGIHKYHPGDGIILSEGPRDLLAAFKLFSGTPLAIMGSKLNRERARGLLALKPSKIILGLDNDEAGNAGTLDCIRHLADHNKLTVLDLPEGCKDLAESLERSISVGFLGVDDWLARENLPNLEQIKLDVAQQDKLATQRRAADELDQGHVKKAQQILTDIKTSEPIQPMAGSDIVAALKTYRDEGGLMYEWMPKLTQALNGIRGLCLIGGAPGVGKTIFACQMAAGLLLARSDYSCLFLSLELSEYEIGRNIQAAATAYGTDFEKLMARFYYQGTLPPGSNDPKAILDFLSQGRFTGSPIVVVDRVQLLPEKGGSDLHRDEQRYDWVTELRNVLYPHPVLCISELAKVHWSSGWLGMESFKGSGRGGHAADSALVITPLTDAQMLANLERLGDEWYPSERFKHSVKTLDEAEQETASIWREALCQEKKDYQVIHIVKARNGVRTQIPVTNLYGQRHYREGFR
jgi:hypothetical protein